MLFTKDKMAVVLRGLYENINGHDGVKICLKQGSCNFENWIQIELCRHLQNEFSSDFDIKIEEKVGPFVKVVLNQLPLPGASNYIDVLMSPKLNDGSVVIEIKIARLGGDKSDVKINRIKKDINKLILFDKEKDQRILLCVVYKTEGAFEKGWGPFVGKGEGDYQKDIINCLKLKDLYNERNHFTCPENGMINGVREILLDCFIF